MNFLRKLFGMKPKVKINNSLDWNTNDIKRRVKFLSNYLSMDEIITIWNTRGPKGLMNEMEKHRPRPQNPPAPPKLN